MVPGKLYSQCHPATRAESLEEVFLGVSERLRPAAGPGQVWGGAESSCQASVAITCESVPWWLPGVPHNPRPHPDPGTCERGLFGERVLADVIKLRVLL